MDKMKSIYMYAHGGSGNHGCEAIVRSTLELIKEFPNPKYLVSACPEQDIKYGIDKECEILTEKSDWSKFSLEFLKAYAALKVKKNYIPLDRLEYKKTVDKVKEGDLVLSIGGDNYCYADVNRYIMLHNMYKKQGAKTVLWGCSVEPELVRKKTIASDLARYDLIIARETISYQALKQINPNTILVPDTAFMLENIQHSLPAGFLEGNYVGLNLSPMVIEKEKTPGIILDNYVCLIDYILNETDLNVLLIPHVVWADGDDREVLKELYNHFKDSNRIALVDDADCRVLKGYICRSRFFIGARTHSTIAAYSSNVPTLVLGYSVKARGIAQDLFETESDYNIDAENIDSRGTILNSFKFLLEHEEDCKNKLTTKRNKMSWTPAIAGLKDLLK